MGIFHPAMLVYQRADGQTCPPFFGRVQEVRITFGCFFFERKEDVNVFIMCLEDFFWDGFTLFFLPTVSRFLFGRRFTLKKSEVSRPAHGTKDWRRTFPQWELRFRRCFFRGDFFGFRTAWICIRFWSPNPTIWLKSLGLSTVEIMKEPWFPSISYEKCLEKVNTKYWLSQMVVKDGDFHPMGS